MNRSIVDAGRLRLAAGPGIFRRMTRRSFPFQPCLDSLDELRSQLSRRPYSVFLVNLLELLDSKKIQVVHQIARRGSTMISLEHLAYGVLRCRHGLAAALGDKAAILAARVVLRIPGFEEPALAHVLRGLQQVEGLVAIDAIED